MRARKSGTEGTVKYHYRKVFTGAPELEIVSGYAVIQALNCSSRHARSRIPRTALSNRAHVATRFFATFLSPLQTRQ